MKFRCVTKRNQ